MLYEQNACPVVNRFGSTTGVAETIKASRKQSFLQGIFLITMWGGQERAVNREISGLPPESPKCKLCSNTADVYIDRAWYCDPCAPLKGWIQ